MYNRQQQIHHAIDSVVSQTRLPLEIIIVDDASNDATVTSVAARRKDPVPIRIIALQQNRGGGHARNVGIDAANGEWIAFLDSDDRWQKEKLFLQMNASKCCSSGDTVQFCNLAVDRGSNLPLVDWNCQPFVSGDCVANYVLERRQAVQTSTLLVPTHLARRIRFDERLRRHQDIDFVLRLAREGVRFHYLERPLVIYSADPNVDRVSHRKNAAPSLEWLKIAQEYTSKQALSYFYAREIFPIDYEDKPLTALKRLFGHWARKEIKLDLAVNSAVRMLAPGSIKRLIRRIQKIINF